ncbi:HEPN domain-containing protein [uncultured Tolumonas sp.]|uniref:HEPN domain-containing protein n=1 Tax=uncultured Tolumonas sp. TaxID=263765 RepID=UPI00292F7A3D|nr:HEPN domain-containing protein [uncultured Tolumonas sp.]
MRKSLLGELFGIAVSRPIELNNIIQIVEIIPKVVIEQANFDGKSFDDTMKNIISEVLNFAEQLEPEESEIFLELFESECSTRMTKSVDNDFESIDPSETKWNFYIRFKVSEPLGLDQNAIDFLGNYQIKPAKKQSLKDDNILILTSSDSMTYREIMFESKKVEQALILGLAELGIGVAYPENLASEATLEKIKREAEIQFLKQHTKLYDSHYERPLFHFSDKFGVVLFQERSFPWDSNANEEKEPVDITKLDAIFSSVYDNLKGLQVIGRNFNKIEIATSILTTSIFEDSLINKIILSMTVIEVLSDKVSRSDEELRVLDYLTNVLDEKSDIDQSEKESITKALTSLRYQSISKSCKALVKDLLGSKDAKLFYKLYDYRSQLVHAGVLENNRDEMLKIYYDSYGLAKRVLMAYINRLDESD